MKCEHCGYEAPERAVICPECGEILPRPKKPAAEEQAKKEPSPAAEKFSMPFLSAPADLEKADGYFVICHKILMIGFLVATLFMLFFELRIFIREKIYRQRKE